VTSDKNS